MNAPAMPRLDDIRYGGVTIGLWSVTEDETALAQLCAERGIAPRHDGAGSAARRIERLVEQLLLQNMVGSASLEHDASGAPFVPHNDTCISISHTRGLVALSLAQFKHGVDVEYHSDRIGRVSRRFLTADELSRFTDVNTQLIAWTAKEAMFKCAGDDTLTMTCFTIDRLPDGHDTGLGQGPQGEYKLATWPINQRFILTLSIPLL